MDKRKILFADDDPEIREVVRILLESEGYQVVEAENGEQAASAADDTKEVKYAHFVPHGPHPGLRQDHGIWGRR